MRKMFLLIVLFIISSCKTTYYNANEIDAPVFLKDELERVKV